METVGQIYSKMSTNELTTAIINIKNEMVELFESKGDQDKYQGLRLHRETARAELRSRGDITDIVGGYIGETL